MKYASHDFLVCMDDDDFYPAHSIKTRIKVLLKYPEINMVGCGMVCCYDVFKDAFYVAGGKTTLAEATYAYRRSFWEKRNFNPRIRLGEGVLFLRDRKEECYRIPYTFVLFVMNHKSNVTGLLRQEVKREYFINHYILPEEIMEILKKIHS